MSSPTYASGASNTRLNGSLTAAGNATSITNGNGGGGSDCCHFGDGSAGLSAQRSSSSNSVGVGANVGFNGAGVGGDVSSFVYHTMNVSSNGDMLGGIDGGGVQGGIGDGGIRGGFGGGFGAGFGASGGSVPHETDDIADILDVGLLKGLGERRCVIVVPFLSGVVSFFLAFV